MKDSKQKLIREKCKVCGRNTYKDECMFDHNDWVEVKDAPIPDIKTLMFYIEAYRSPQGHLEPQEFLKGVQALIEKYVATLERQVREGTIKEIQEKIEKKKYQWDKPIDEMPAEWYAHNEALNSILSSLPQQTECKEDANCACWKKGDRCNNCRMCKVCQKKGKHDPKK